jgi:hypothetical protein
MHKYKERTPGMCKCLRQCQKRPIIKCQKRPAKCQKRPVFSVKRDLFSVKRDLLSVKRDHFSVNRGPIDVGVRQVRGLIYLFIYLFIVILYYTILCDRFVG